MVLHASSRTPSGNSPPTTRRGFLQGLVPLPTSSATTAMREVTRLSFAPLYQADPLYPTSMPTGPSARTEALTHTTSAKASLILRATSAGRRATTQIGAQKVLWHSFPRRLTWQLSSARRMRSKIPPAFGTRLSMAPRHDGCITSINLSFAVD